MKQHPTGTGSRLQLNRQTVARLQSPDLVLVRAGKNAAALTGTTSVPCVVTVSHVTSCWGNCPIEWTSLTDCEQVQ